MELFLPTRHSGNRLSRHHPFFGSPFLFGNPTSSAFLADKSIASRTPAGSSRAQSAILFNPEPQDLKLRVPLVPSQYQPEASARDCLTFNFASLTLFFEV
jgi:hypothetical protein